MLLTFLRHAEAEATAPSDHDRQLTSKGREQAQKVGEFCKQHGIVPGMIVTSPVTRAEQTAGIVAKCFGDIEPMVERWLACGMDPVTCLDGLRSYAQFEHVMLVGHEPDFGETIAACIGLPYPGTLHIRKASLTTIEMNRLRAGSGRLEYTIPVRFL